MEWMDIKECEGRKRKVYLRSGNSFIGTILFVDDFKSFLIINPKIVLLDKLGNKISFYLRDIEAIETIKGIKDGE